MIVIAGPDYRIVYVVDSHPQDYAELRRQLAENELQLQIFSTGRDALRTDAAQPPNLWVINLRLPDMHGADLRAMLRWSSLRAPVVLVSDGYDRNAEIVAGANGPDMFLCKPLESAGLMPLLRWA
jgi:DNA-binding response OmpR family regulator